MVMHPEAINSKGIFLQLVLKGTRGGHITRTKKELGEIILLEDNHMSEAVDVDRDL